MTIQRRTIRAFSIAMATGLLIMLTAIALVSRSARAEQRSTSAPAITAINGVAENQSLNGTVAIEAVVKGRRIKRVEFHLSGPQSAVHIEKAAPYLLFGDKNGVPNGWDTTQYPNGDYTLDVMAINSAGEQASQTIHFTLANGIQQPTAIPQPTAVQATPVQQPTAAPQPTALPQPTAAPQPATGASYYVATSGADSNNGTESQPFRTLAKGASVLKPGDVLLIKPGTYNESLEDAIPSGTDWSKPVTIKAADPSNRPVLLPASGAGWVLHFQSRNGQLQHHIIVDGLVVDAKNVQYDAVKITSGAHHIRLMNSEIRNAPRQGILTSEPGSDYNEFIQLDVHNNGGNTQLDHGFYISTSNNLIASCLVHNNAGYGIHIYSGADTYKPNQNVVRDNVIYEQGLHAGMIVASGSGNTVYNNVVRDNRGTYGRGIEVAYGASGTRIVNNTVVGNSDIGIYVYSDASSTELVNNIVANNGSSAIQNDAPSSLQVKNNLVYGKSGIVDTTGGQAKLSGNISGRDPMFVDPATANLHLQPASPAIDTGLAVTDAATAQDGTARPQGAGFDIGAYEYQAP